LWLLSLSSCLRFLGLWISRQLVVSDHLVSIPIPGRFHLLCCSSQSSISCILLVAMAMLVSAAP
jgi:hypothetical protein